MAEVKDRPKVEEKAVLEQPKEAVRKVEQIIPARVKEASYARTHWSCTVASGTVPEDLLKPEYWSHIAVKMRPRDQVEAWSDDGTWYAEYVVRACDRSWAMLAPKMKLNFNSAEIPVEDSPYAVSHRGAHDQWSVTRKSDGAVLFKEGRTREEADAWMRQYIRTVT